MGPSLSWQAPPWITGTRALSRSEHNYREGAGHCPRLIANLHRGKKDDSYWTEKISPEGWGPRRLSRKGVVLSSQGLDTGSKHNFSSQELLLSCTILSYIHPAPGPGSCEMLGKTINLVMVSVSQEGGGGTERCGMSAAVHKPLVVEVKMRNILGKLL